ncbi:MAG: tetratricopeptide repeat protein [Desulfomonilaceae bacterium]
MRRSPFVCAVLMLVLGSWSLSFAETAKAFHDKGEASVKASCVLRPGDCKVCMDQCAQLAEDGVFPPDCMNRCMREREVHPKVISQTAQDLHNEGEAAYKEGNCAKAVECYTKALKVDPECHESRYARAVNYYKLKNYLAAKHDFENLLEIPNIAPHAFHYIGLIHCKANEQDKALAAFKRASDLNPKNLTYRLNAARAAVASGDRILAMRYYRQAAVLDSRNKEAERYIAGRKAAIERYEGERFRKQWEEQARQQREIEERHQAASRHEGGSRSAGQRLGNVRRASTGRSKHTGKEEK